MNEHQTLTGLLEHYSPSGQERQAVEWLVARMGALGYDRAYRDPAGNAVGLLGQGPRQLVLLGHIDTVPGEIPVRLDPSGRLHGRGAVDAKGPLACFVDAAARTGARPGWQLVVIGAVDEERYSAGARYLVDQYRPDYAVIGEPNQWDRLALGYKGSAAAQVTLLRPQGHSAAGGQTAAEAGVQAWLRLQSFAETFNRDRPKLFDRLLLSLAGIEAGQDAFEQWARLQVGARLPLDLPPQDWYARLAELLAEFEQGSSEGPSVEPSDTARQGSLKVSVERPGAAHQGSLKVSIERPGAARQGSLKVSIERPGAARQGSLKVSIERPGAAIPAWKCDKNTPLVRAFLSAIRSQGGEPRFVYKTGTADLNIVAPAWGCPCLVYGPGDSAFDHTPDEQIELEDYDRAVGVMVEVLKNIS